MKSLSKALNVTMKKGTVWLYRKYEYYNLHFINSVKVENVLHSLVRYKMVINKWESW